MDKTETVTREEVFNILTKVERFNKEGVRKLVFHNNAKSGSLTSIIETLAMEVDSLNKGVEFYKNLLRAKEEECDYVGFQLYKLRKSLNYDMTDFYVEDEIRSFETMLKDESET
jgi:hypothetical protein